MPMTDVAGSGRGWTLVLPQQEQNLPAGQPTPCGSRPPWVPATLTAVIGTSRTKLYGSDGSFWQEKEPRQKSDELAAPVLR